MIQVDHFPIQGLKLIHLKAFFDDRGFFCERWNPEIKAQLPDLQDPVQDNFSKSKPQVLRGLHYQFAPPQGKLVTCLRGEIFDVAVDLRANSPTFGKYQSVVLSGDKPSWFWVPAGFAHVFLNIGQEDCEVMYKVNALYSSKGEACIYWKDEDLKIAWPVTQPLCSEKDQKGGRFQDYMKNPNFT